MILCAITPADGAVPTFFLATAINSPGFTKIGASPRSTLSVGNWVSTADEAGTWRVPIMIDLRAFVVADSAVARDTAVCQKFRVHISLYPPPVIAVCTNVSILTPRTERRLPE